MNRLEGLSLGPEWRAYEEQKRRDRERMADLTRLIEEEKKHAKRQPHTDPDPDRDPDAAD
jgi:hypothetical protein